uniref:Transthyretin-like family protein n=1 Tax=Gongylonema pulchrum TaxID=637853 RepID=A0A183D1M0_9BILA
LIRSRVFFERFPFLKCKSCCLVRRRMEDKLGAIERGPHTSGAMFRLLLLLSLSPVAFCAFGGLIGRVQSAGVRGTLMCNGRPANRVLVKLYDDDRGIDMDDFMGEAKSDSQGNFEPCQRKISIMIPDGYITEAKVPKKWYNVGNVELAGKFAGETRDCIH